LELGRRSVVVAILVSFLIDQFPPVAVPPPTILRLAAEPDGRRIAITCRQITPTAGRLKVSTVTRENWSVLRRFGTFSLSPGWDDLALRKRKQRLGVASTLHCASELLSRFVFLDSYRQFSLRKKRV